MVICEPNNWFLAVEDDRLDVTAKRTETMRAVENLVRVYVKLTMVR